MCLDCNLECEDGYCNSKVDVNCIDCLDKDSIILNTILSYQTDVIDCLEKEFNFTLPRIVKYKIKSFGDICDSQYYCESHGSSDATQVYNEGFIGIINGYEQRVNSTAQ